MMIKVTLRAHEERLVMKALQIHRNKLTRERNYDGVSRTAYNRMSQNIRDIDNVMGRIGDL
jgi:hypothetical protein